MLATDLIRKHSPCCWIPNLGKKIGDGANGEVFELQGDASKIVKISILYAEHPIVAYIKLQRSLDNLIINGDKFLHICRAHDVGMIFSSRDFVAWFYTADKLQHITEDEKKVFNTLLSHEDRNKRKIFSDEELDEVIGGLSKGLDFDEEKVREFYYAVNSGKVFHRDIHERNIMKNEVGFQLVDLDAIDIRSPGE